MESSNRAQIAMAPRPLNAWVICLKHYKQYYAACCSCRTHHKDAGCKLGRTSNIRVTPENICMAGGCMVVRLCGWYLAADNLAGPVLLTAVGPAVGCMGNETKNMTLPHQNSMFAGLLKFQKGAKESIMGDRSVRRSSRHGVGR